MQSAKTIAFPLGKGGEQMGNGNLRISRCNLPQKPFYQECEIPAVPTPYPHLFLRQATCIYTGYGTSRISGQFPKDMPVNLKYPFPIHPIFSQFGTAAYLIRSGNASKPASKFVLFLRVVQLIARRKYYRYIGGNMKMHQQPYYGYL